MNSRNANPDPGTPPNTSKQQRPLLPVVVIGGSAGALEPLRELVSLLPATLPAAVLVALHCPPDVPSYLPQILQAISALPVHPARQGDVLQAGHLYTARPNRHLLVAGEQLRLGSGPRENLSRPSIDVLFRSAAYTHRAAVIGVLLSGMLGDGTSGLWTIKRLGGQVIVQHPEEALYPGMPLSALQNTEVDAILPVQGIAARLQTMLAALEFGRPNEDWEDTEMTERELHRLELEVGVADGANAFAAGILNEGAFTAFTCPECHGVMVKLQEGRALRFRCHTGHAYTAQALLSELRQAGEVSLWNAVRGMEEHVMLLEHLAKHNAEASEAASAELYRQEAEAVRRRIEPLRLAATQPGEAHWWPPDPQPRPAAWRMSEPDSAPPSTPQSSASTSGDPTSGDPTSGDLEDGPLS